MNRYVILGLLIVIGLSACTPEGDGYRFIVADIEPLTDASGLIYITQPTDTYEIVASFENTMHEDATNVRMEIANVNFDLADFSAFEQAVSDTAGTIPGTGSNGNTLAFVDADIPISQPRAPSYSTNVHYHLCARTTTVYEDTVCLAPSGQPGTYDVTCDTLSKRVTGGQEAPVAVVGVRQSNSIDRVVLSVDLINHGSGFVFRGDTCSFIDQEDAGRVQLEELRIGTVDLTSSCANEIIRLGYDQRYQERTGSTFKCIIDKGLLDEVTTSGSTVEAAMLVRFSYDYHVLVEKQPIILRKE